MQRGVSPGAGAGASCCRCGAVRRPGQRSEEAHMSPPSGGPPSVPSATPIIADPTADAIVCARAGHSVVGRMDWVAAGGGAYSGTLHMLAVRSCNYRH